MTTSNISPFFPLRDGSWIDNTAMYAQFAKDNLAELLELVERIKTFEQERIAQGDDPEYAHYLSHNLRSRAKMLSVTVEIFCCMSVEAFLNFYGVVCLGEEFYKRNCERLGITQKLEILLATCKQVTLERDEEITQLTRRMFDRRNRIVHPKAIEIWSWEEHERKYPSIDIIAEAKQRVEDMKRFYKLLCNYDVTVSVYVDFIIKENNTPLKNQQE